MIIDPAQYTSLVEEVRILKAMNDVLTYENKAILQQYVTEKQQKQKLMKQYNQFSQKITLQHNQLLENCKNQVKKLIEQFQKKKQQQILFFQKKVSQLQKGTYNKMKSLQIQYKDHRLKSHLNDQFVNKLLKLYGGQQNPGLPQLYLWIKKLSMKKQPKQELSIIVESQKQNKKVSTKSLLKSQSKKKLLQVPK